MLLVISTSGVIINKHYSGGELFSASFFVEAESCCETSCCHHEHQNNCSEVSDFYKVNTDFISPEDQDNEKSHLLLFNCIDLELIWNTSLALNYSDRVLKHSIYKPPPLRDDLAILHRPLLL